MHELLRRSIITIIFLILTVLVCSMEDDFVFANNNNNGEVIRCIETEREALLKFKEGLIDEFGMMSSWGKRKDCCKWEGVQCSNTIGHVIGIQLLGDGPFSYLGGEINSALLELHHLNVLDLSYNHFGGNKFPEIICSMSQLQHLDLSWSGFFGTLPLEIGNLTNLESLDLSGNEFNGTLPLEIGNLTNLESLDLSGNNFNGTLPIEIGSLTGLETLNLAENNFFGTLQSQIKNLINLKTLVLSRNQFSGTLPSEIGNLTNLESLDLSSCHFSAIPQEIGNLINLEMLDLSDSFNFSTLPSTIGNLLNLKTLDLSYNINLSSIPLELWNLTNLESLDLSYNQLSEIVHPRIWRLNKLKNIDLTENYLSFHVGTNQVAPSLRTLNLDGNKLKRFPSSIWQFSMLEELRVSSNSLMEDTITEAELIKLPNLKVLDLSSCSLTFYNNNPSDLSSCSLTLDISPDWTPPFQLSEIYLSGCKVGPYFPSWLRTQSNFRRLDLSNSSISGEVPNWFWNLSPEADTIDLSHNQLSGTISNFSSIGRLELSFNKFSGPMPLLSPTTEVLVISQNMFSGSLLFNCSLIFHNLVVLDLSNNQLSGNIHNCWKKMGELMFLNLANNNFSGEIPHALGYLFNLKVLFLANNNFHGKLPSTLKECSDLHLIDIGDNMLNGSIPIWIGEYHESMGYLILRNNRFHGSIPPQICYLSSIQVLDLSGNNISGNVPLCFSNLTHFVSEDTFPGYTVGVDDIDIVQHATIHWKGMEYEYARGNLNHLKLIDLSCNKLDGNIPRAFSSLKTLHSLNLSRNRLTGMIDPDIGNMRSLESLDLSSNRLSGVIPNGMAQLTFLSVLNLSNNNLSGKIPIGRQLQLFNASAYAGNIALCGDPLQPCPGDRFDPPNNNVDEEDDDGILSLSFLKDYGISIILGFAFGFWGVVGSLIVKESWRRMFYNFWDDVGDWVYVRVTIFWTKLRRSRS